ncbi:MAG: bifunctional proline dehydrogenase/L-glutamate gamma-semialdehyde dehydrogenase PutA [Litoreibacter sp.]|nr:bifunctional proline dehydrogenase/L-glutamate gamma-semialdehyde dehydrogenase PutA [Litoreibacter sp.]
MTSLNAHRAAIRAAHLMPAQACIEDLVAGAAISLVTRKAAGSRAAALVRDIRDEGKPGIMEVFLAEYGLSTQEGVALMCLAEALLRVPDTETIDALIEDKIAPSAWGSHLGHSSSQLVNASTWALMLTGKVLSEETQGMAALLKGAVKRLGEPVIRTAVQRAMKELGHQFVLGRTIDEAIRRAEPQEAEGYTFSYDMLGEAALTARDARGYFKAYRDAITAISARCGAGDIRENPGISVKLSALHPRYELLQRDRVMSELVPRVQDLARQARAGGMGFNIDAEEADRLDLSLDVIEAVIRDPALAGWDGFGVVVQAYGKRAAGVLDWLYTLSTELDRKIMVRLVKGAYWDTEVKRSQVEGLADFPVFTRKSETDVSYLCCARKLLGMTDRIYPQFATHNAHTMASILEMAEDLSAFEFQRLQGMGAALHRRIHGDDGARCRIYAPVGAHRDLLAYLVRRLLENGANSSFVNQIVDETVAPERVAADPFDTLSGAAGPVASAVVRPCDLFAPARRNSQGWDLHSDDDLEGISEARDAFEQTQWRVGPRCVPDLKRLPEHEVLNPSDPSDPVGHVAFAGAGDAAAACEAARTWLASASERAAVLRRIAVLYEENFGLFFAVLCREAGKTLSDAVAELREAVDFLRYYANEAERLATRSPRGIIGCISPWNFPLAIFTGQISAALAAGNGVVAKPAESTSITAVLAVDLMHNAGVPRDVLQLLPGRGAEVGAELSRNPAISGVCFTGSTATAQQINRAMAKALDPAAPLIAETGGLNAMIVDSTALPQQAITDIVVSAFQSAGQRCSALRVLYVQDDIADGFLDMLFGAMDELKLGDPWQLATDIGPVIDATAKAGILRHVEVARAEERILEELPAPEVGHFVAPTVIKVTGIADLGEELFGPVLHVARFEIGALDAVVDDINAAGYGLTFGMHSRIDDRVEQVTARIKAGNLYINRNQIGAIVGSQPFGGEGLSGTGPKAGGPDYVRRFCAPEPSEALGVGSQTDRSRADTGAVKDALAHANPPEIAQLETNDLPGPTGESNRLSVHGRGTVLCLGPGAVAARVQAQIARENGCAAVLVASGLLASEGPDGLLDPSALETLSGFDLVAMEDSAGRGDVREALAARPGPIIGLASAIELAERCRLERHICIDTTAAGGNTNLLAASA